MKKRVITVKVPDIVYEDLRRIAEKRMLSISDIVRQAILKYLKDIRERGEPI